MKARHRKPSKADPFDVWGTPPPPLDRLPPKHLKALRRYVESVAGKAHRVAHSNGLVEGLCKISMIAAAELKAHRDQMFRSR